MFCFNCGTQLQDEANFCWKCGKPQKGGVASFEEPKWETCEIKYEKVRRVSLTTFANIFYADAIGFQGRYKAGESPEFQKAPEYYDLQNSTIQAIMKAAHNALVDQLIRDGWEPVETRGNNWWNDRFRRRMKASANATNELK